MNYEVEFSEKFKKSMQKLMKKNHHLSERINKKLLEIAKNPERFKPFKNELFELRRIHFGSFVLTFSINKNIIRIISLSHHDKAY